MNGDGAADRGFRVRQVDWPDRPGWAILWAMVVAVGLVTVLRPTCPDATVGEPEAGS